MECIWTNEFAAPTEIEVVPNGCIDIYWSGTGLHVAGPNTNVVTVGVPSAATITGNLAKAPGPAEVAAQIVRSIEGSHRPRWPAGGRARLLSRLRRFMPHAPVDRSIRGVFGLPRV